MSVFNIITGQQTINEYETDSMIINVIEFLVGGETLTADLLLPHSAPEHATPLIGVLRKDDKPIWKFNMNKPAFFAGRAHLLEVDGEAVIAFVNKASNQLVSIDTIASITSGVVAGLKRSATLKLESALKLGVETSLTSNEAKVMAKLDRERVEVAKALMQKREAQKKLENEQRRLQREARRQAILGRQQLKVQDASGKPLYGVPVINDEADCLADGTWVVLVSSYESGSGRIGELLRHFVVDKRNGRFSEKSVTNDISFKVQPQSTSAKAPEPIGTELFEFDGDVHEVAVYRTQDLPILKEAGVLGAFASKVKDGGYVVGRNVLQEGSLKTLTVDARQFA